LRLAKRSDDFEAPHISECGVKKLHGKLCLREFFITRPGRVAKIYLSGSGVTKRA